MKIILLLTVYLSFVIYSNSQTLTLNELESYSKNSLEDFSLKILKKGYKLSYTEDDLASFQFYTKKNVYAINYSPKLISYTTSYKKNYLDIIDEMELSKYQYIGPTFIEQSFCNEYEKEDETIFIR